MGWEFRRRGGRYYRRSVRDQEGRPRHEYFGAGENAGLFARSFELLAEKEQGEREERRRQIAALSAEVAPIEAAATGLDQAVAAIVAATLTAAGYHKPWRGPWRKKRQGAVQMVDEQRSAREIPEGERMTILRRAAAGETELMPVVKKILDAFPHCVVSLWSQSGRDTLLDAMLYNEPFEGEVVGREAERLWEELAGPRPTVLEKLLVERIVVGWLATNWYEARMAQALKKGCSFETATFWQQTITQADRRYLAAIRNLAMIRRLQLPADLPLQVPADALSKLLGTNGCHEPAAPRVEDRKR